MTHSRDDERDASAPPSPPYAPYPPYPPYPPFPPFPPYPAVPCCAPCAGGSADVGAQDGTGADGRHEDGRHDGRGDDGDGHDGDGHDGDGDKRGPDRPPPGPHGGPGPGGEGPLLPPRIAVRRPDDLLVFDLIFGGFGLKTNPPRIERLASDAYIVIEFPPQSFGEEAYLEAANQPFETAPDDNVEVSSHPDYPDKNVPGAGTEPLPNELPAARVRMATPSRVGVSMPADVASLGFDLVSVLTALRDWPMRLDGAARPDPVVRLPGLIEAATVAGLGDLLRPAGGIVLSSGGQALVPASAPIAQPALGFASGVDLEDLTPLPILAGPREPAPTVTALELPYRLITSPIESAHWAHTLHPVEHHGRTELWHTRLTTSESAVGADAPSRIRALWSPDYRPEDRLDEIIGLLKDPDLIRMSLDPVDRSMLVTLMARYDTFTDGKRYRPVSSEAKRLHLSALGALLDAEGTWTVTPDDVDLEQWRHLATLGRDHYVRVMYKGYLCPFQHAASLIKVTERKFEWFGAARRQRVAVLRQRFFIVVREPVRYYPGARHQFGGRNFPFKSVEILTRVTPDLLEPGVGASGLKPAEGVADFYTGAGAIAERMLFWPMVPAAVGAADVPFEIAAVDIAGQRVTFSLPLLFVGKLADAKKAADLKKSYNKPDEAGRRRALLGGAKVCYAPAAPSDKGDPNLPTQTVTFRAGDFTTSTPAIKPNFHPEVDVAECGIKPIQKLLGQPSFIAEVAYPDFYKTDGLGGANVGQVFLKLTKAKQLAFGGGAQAKSDSLGALASPQMTLLGLSKVMGPVSGNNALDPAQVETELGTVKQGKFDPTQFFKDATLLGGIKLGEILTTATDLSGNNVPKLLSRDLPERTETTFDWDTEVTKPDVLKLLVPRADTTKPPTRLTMHGVMQTPFDPAESPTFEATATMTNFKINLFGFIILWFERATFSSKNGQKPDVLVQLRDSDEAVSFGGPLEFVNELRKFIPSNGFSDPPGLSVTPSGISASYSLNLPSVGVGVFALTNASLGAGFSLPFDGSPASVKFNFSAREHPFSLTVSLLGGGGFFLIGVSARGVNEIEAALEFGAAVVIDLGVASGGVEIKAGVYFHWLEPVPDEGSVELAGYVRIHGELTVLAIISVSLTFNLQLGYLKADGKGVAYGEATLTVEIEILMFSAEVSVSCRREFAGGAADPRFIALIPTQQVWTDYCEAFADEAA